MGLMEKKAAVESKLAEVENACSSLKVRMGPFPVLNTSPSVRFMLNLGSRMNWNRRAPTTSRKCAVSTSTCRRRMPRSSSSRSASPCSSAKRDRTLPRRTVVLRFRYGYHRDALTNTGHFRVYARWCASEKERDPLRM